VFALIFFLGPGCADLHPAHAYLLVASLHSLFSVLYFDAHSICPLLLFPPLFVLVPWFNNLPAGCSTSYHHAPSSLACFCPFICPTHSPSCSCPSHGDNGNAWLRFFTAGSGGRKGAASSREHDLKGIILIFSSRACGGGDLDLDKPSYVHSESFPPLPFLILGRREKPTSEDAGLRGRGLNLRCTAP
jgi:hypothetical protein